MRSRFFQTVVAPMALLVGVAVAACSSQSQEASAEGDQALTHCPAGYKLHCETVDFSQPPRTVCTCDPFDFYGVAPPPAGATCSDAKLAVPSALAPYGCTLGVVSGGLPVWACPIGTPFPSSLGVVPKIDGGTMPVCSWGDAGKPTNTSCEVVWGFTQSTMECVGNAPSGWMFILDGYVLNRDGGNGGCAGQCAMPFPPTGTIVVGTHH
jgi:hypothetical protein